MCWEAISSQFWRQNGDLLQVEFHLKHVEFIDNKIWEQTENACFSQSQIFILLINA